MSFVGKRLLQSCIFHQNIFTEARIHQESAAHFILVPRLEVKPHAGQWTMVYCFIWLSQQTGALQEAIALSQGFPNFLWPCKPFSILVDEYVPLNMGAGRMFSKQGPKVDFPGAVV